VEIELTSDIDASMAPAILDLEYEESRPLYEFVYGDEAEARRAQRVVWDAGAGEWTPPHTLVVMLDGEFSGMLGGLMAEDLGRARMAASLALGRAGMLKDKDRAGRAQKAIESLVQPSEGDYYYPVIGMLPSVRKTGFIPELFELVRRYSRERGARRVVFQAPPTCPAW
jgi:hypothetical protein